MTNEERINSLEVRVSALETRISIAEVNIEHINKKLDVIESNTTWLLRIVISFVITAVLGFVFTQTK